MAEANYQGMGNFFADADGDPELGGWFGRTGSGPVYVTQRGVNAYIARRLLDRDQSPLPREIRIFQDGRVYDRPRNTIPGLA
jgi:hypothetical protein